MIIKPDIPEYSGYPDTYVDNVESSRLAGEYLGSSRHIYGMFSGNMERYRSKVANVLKSRGYTHIENMFGNIEIKA